MASCVACGIQAGKSVLMETKDRTTEYSLRKDISIHWYHLCRGAIPTEHIVIDLHPDRLGRCYDAFLQNYATGDMKIVALSFTELLSILATCNGDDLFWDRDSFKSLGYAYDDVYGP
jgi:antitoxin YokJ